MMDIELPLTFWQTAATFKLKLGCGEMSCKGVLLMHLTKDFFGQVLEVSCRNVLQGALQKRSVNASFDVFFFFTRLARKS